MSSDEWFLELWKRVMGRNPTVQQRKGIMKAVEIGKVFRESGVWDELKKKYGEDKSVRIWDFLVALYEGDSFRARALFEALENKLP